MLSRLQVVFLKEKAAPNKAPVATVSLKSDSLEMHFTALTCDYRLGYHETNSKSSSVYFDWTQCFMVLHSQQFLPLRLTCEILHGINGFVSSRSTQAYHSGKHSQHRFSHNQVPSGRFSRLLKFAPPSAARRDDVASTRLKACPPPNAAVSVRAPAFSRRAAVPRRLFRRHCSRGEPAHTASASPERKAAAFRPAYRPCQHR